MKTYLGSGGLATWSEDQPVEGSCPTNNAQERLMMVRTVRTVHDLPTATHGETVRCLIAIELSKKSWVVALNTPLSEKISRRTLTGYHI